MMAGRSAAPLLRHGWVEPRSSARGFDRSDARALRDGRDAQRGTLRGKVLAPRPALTAALRVPERGYGMNGNVAYIFPHTGPQLFVHEGARQALERRLTSAFPGPVILHITDNTHSIISHKLTNGVLRARIHHMFLDAPRGVVDALVRYVVAGEKEASSLVGDYIEAHGPRIVRAPRKTHLVTRGKHHDLLSIFDEVNRKYFGGSVDALITWGKRSTNRGRKVRSTIKLGSYSAAERLIRIHPSLDRTWVPRYFLAFVVYHEMLHHVMPSTVGQGRATLHPPEFRARERQFGHFERALAWERGHISRLLRT